MLVDLTQQSDRGPSLLFHILNVCSSKAEVQLSLARDFVGSPSDSKLTPPPPFYRPQVADGRPKATYVELIKSAIRSHEGEGASLQEVRVSPSTLFSSSLESLSEVALLPLPPSP